MEDLCLDTVAVHAEIVLGDLAFLVLDDSALEKVGGGMTDRGDTY